MPTSFEAFLAVWSRLSLGWKENVDMRGKILVGILAVSGLLATASASAVTITVDGKSNIWGAGHTSPGADGSGVLPPVFAFSAGAGQVVEFSSVTGLVSPSGGPPNIGPDGAPDTRALNGASGISGITPGSVLALVGVFLDDSEPAGTPPVSLNFIGGQDFLSLAPDLRQLFFIGDGLTGTGTGTVQSFIIPDAATRLYLGTIDGHAAGSPGLYGDNGGSFTATLSISRAPEPVSLVLVALGLAGVGFSRRRNPNS